MRKLVVSASLCLALAGASAGCFGKYALTGKLYKFNQDISGNKFVRTIAMWAMIIVPVYEVGLLADWLVFNTIEFWTGSNILAQNGDLGDAGKLAVVEQPDGSATFERGDVTYRLVPNGATSFVVERDGIRLGTAELTDEGGLRVLDAEGNTVRALSAAELEARAAEAEMIASQM